MSDDLKARLRARTRKTLPNDWKKGLKCPDCGSDADRPKCMWDHGPSCARHDPDAYDPPPYAYVADKDCTEALARIEALEAALTAMTAGRDGWKDSSDEYERLFRNGQARLAKAVEALREIIARWDTPAWKEVEPTGAVINRARATLAEIEIPADAENGRATVSHMQKGDVSPTSD